MKFGTLLLALAIGSCGIVHADKTEMAQNITNYLSTTYPCSVNYVEVTEDNVIITGTCPADGQFALVEITPADEVTENTEFRLRQPIDNNQAFSITVDRKTTYDGIGYDRIFSRWAIVEATTGSDVLASHARYADKTPILSSPAELVPTTKKGVGAGLGQVYMNDLVELGAKNITCNMVMNWHIAKSPIYSNNIEYTYNGQKYYINGTEISMWDWHLSFYEQNNIAVSAIVLITPNSTDAAMTPIFCHPENSGGNYTMPNMTTMESINAYAAILEFFAKRYNGTGHGRINHWIMHNEVDMGTEWTNMGTQPEMVYTNEYIKSMRMCYNIVRQYDQNASIMASFTHNWTTTSGGNYPSKTMLEHMIQMSNAEGDFLWGVAAHPYPQNLTRPKFWIDDSQSTNDMNTKYITFKNLEVINEWILRPENMYKGTKKRKLFLSENGTNSPSYSETDLANQAAGGAWAWKKTNALPGIDAIMWHNWMDNRAEYGLRIGLHYYSDDETNPGGNKPVWYVWKAADTPEESAVLDPYLEIIDLKEWKEIFLLMETEGRDMESGRTYMIEAEDYDQGGKGVSYYSRNTTSGSDYRSDNDGVNITAYSLLSNGMGIYDMGGSWQTYTGTFLDNDSKTISREMAEENWGSWFTYTFEAKQDLTANIFMKYAAPWRDYGNAAATGCPPGADTYQVEGAPDLNWPKYYAGAMVVSLDGKNLITTQTARPIAPDVYQSRGTNFNVIATHRDQWTSTLNGKEETDTLWVWSKAGGNNSQSSTMHDDPDYRNVPLSKGKHVLKVKSISSPWNLDCIKFDCYVPTAITDITPETTPVTITGGKGYISVKGATQQAQVYTISGILMGTTRDSISLPTGIYIVKHGNQSAKVKVD